MINRRRRIALPRDARGVGITAIILLIFMALVLFGCFTFETGKAQLTQQELNSVCDSSALTGTSMLASMDNSNPALLAANQTQAMNYAAEMLKMNTCVGDTLSTATPAGSVATLSPVAAHQTKYYIELVDPFNNFAPVPVGNANGRAIKVSANYGLVPEMLQHIGFGSFEMRGNSTSALPRLDVVLCFDLSGSMDDSTKVTFVNRHWDTTAPIPPPGKIVYTVLPSKVPGSAILSDYLGLSYASQPQGTAVNTQFPQGLGFARDVTYFSNPLTFRGDVRAQDPNDYGIEPGDYPFTPPGPPIQVASPGPKEFTDMVVNIADPTGFSQPLANSPNTFVGFTFNDPVSGTTYNFTNLATLVEAARGNLESAAISASAKVDPALVGPPQPGICACYRRLAALYSQPIATAMDGAITSFFDLLNKSSDTHFGLVCFTNPSATSTGSSTFAREYINGAPDPTYTPLTFGAISASKSFPVPGVALNFTNDNYTSGTDVRAQLATGVPMGPTNIGDALKAARQMFQAPGSVRIATRRAVVLFTDGQPTGGFAGTQGALSRTEAGTCKGLGVAIFTIGLAQNAALIAPEKTFLDDTVGSQGIAYLAGNGGRYFPCSTSAQVKTAFENVARRLVVLRQ